MQRSHILSKSALRKAISPRQQRGLHDLKPLREVHAQFLDMVRDQGAGEITFEIDNRIGEIKLRNAKKRNAMSGKMMNDLANIVDEIVPEKSLPCKYDITGLILTGEGDDAFCAGADFHLIKTIVNTSEKGGIMSEFMTDCLERIRQSGVVSLCHINGSAHGGGAELTTTCDFRSMVGGGAVQFVHARIGACPGWGGARRLTSIIGRKNALKAIAASRAIGRGKAMQWGLVDIAAEDVEGGRDFLSQFTKDSLFPGSVHAIKKAIAGVEHLSDDDSRLLELEMFKQRWGSVDNTNALQQRTHYTKTE